MFKLLDVEGVKELHFLFKGLAYPVVLYITTDWEKVQLDYLMKNMYAHNTESVCKWCISHGIVYQIAYPSKTSLIVRNPYRYIKYLQLRHRLTLCSKHNYPFD